MEDVPPYRGPAKPSPPIDEGQYFDYEFKRQLQTPGVTLEKLPPKEVDHVRTHEAAVRHLKTLLLIADSSRKPNFVGLDQEDRGATMQLAYRHNNNKKVVVIQMKSAQKPRPGESAVCLESDGNYNIVIRVITHKNIFSGNGIAADLPALLKSLGLESSLLEKIRIIDTGLQYAFLSNFTRGPEALRVFMATCHENKNRGILGVTSLKYQYEFVKDNVVVDKRLKLRNYFDDFGEIKGRLSGTAIAATMH